MKIIEKLLLLVILIFSIYSCEKHELLTDPSARLSFSMDTVLFDTVFTTIGSTTRQLKVYNPYKQRINVSTIYLATGNNSDFRLNINGIAGSKVDDLEIPARDSIYIFIELTVDPNGINTPMVVQDSIIFITNGNEQDVDLLAWGQDVHLINAEIIKTQTWTNDKPYLIYNSMLVDTGHILTIEQGTQIYLHRNSSILVYGTLIVNGTKDEPVVFQGDRLEKLYDDIPGQWGTIALLSGSENNVINYAEIKNGIAGFQVGEYDDDSNPVLIISNSKIENMSFTGFYAFGSTISASNSVIANCGTMAIALLKGGNYEFYHCTIANYWNYSVRITPSIVISNYFEYEGNLYVRDLENAYFGNCIIYGNLESEIGLAYEPEIVSFNYQFDHCLIKVNADSTDISDEIFFKSILINQDPKFISIEKLDFQLDTLSNAKDKGAIEVGNLFPLDLNQNSRIDDEAPDLGAYERIESNKKKD